MQAVITDDKKSSTLIDVNEMYNIIKKAIKNEKQIFYVGSFVSKEDSYGPIQKITLNKNNISFRFFCLKDNEIIKKIQDITLSSKKSKENKNEVWISYDQENKKEFCDLWLFARNRIIEKKFYAFQILIEDNVYFINYHMFKKLYKMMNEKSINYIFNFQTSKIESCNPPLNFNSQNALDTSFYIPFDLLIEEEVRDKKLEYILTGYCYVRCSNNEVIEINEADFISIYK